jgi:hypothetical protein
MDDLPQSIRVLLCRSVVTGTLDFTAISVQEGMLNSLSSDLESLVYSLIYVATDGRLPWRHQHDENSSKALKIDAIMNAKWLDHQLSALEAKPELIPLITRLARMFRGRQGGYNPVVNVQAFKKACIVELTRLQRRGTGRGGGRGRNVQNGPSTPKASLTPFPAQQRHVAATCIKASPKECPQAASPLRAVPASYRRLSANLLCASSQSYLVSSRGPLQMKLI